MRRIVVLLAGFLLLPECALASGSITNVFVATKRPLAGQPMRVQIGITTDEAAGWAVSEYAVSLRLKSADDKVAAESNPFPGTQAIESGKVSTMFAQWTLPPGVSGYYKLEIDLLHNGTVVSAVPSTIVIAKTTTRAAQSCTRGTTKSTVNFGQPSETTTLSLNGCIIPGQSSYAATAGFSSAPSLVHPVVEITSPQTHFTGGALTPQIDPLSLSGVSGDGALLQRNFGSQHALQMLWLRQQGNPLGPSFATVQYTVNAPTVAAGVGYGHILSPAIPDYGSLATWGEGDFATFSLIWQPPPQRHSFGFRFGLVSYMDADGVTRRVDRAYEAFAGLSIGATQWSLDELRTGPFYLAPGAPNIISDRDAQKLSGSFPIGSITGTLSVEGYRDNLPGANLPVQTNNWAENAAFNIPIRDDLLTLNFSGGSQQQSGDFPSAYSTNAFNATYVLRRGVHNVQFSYAITGMNAGVGQQQTQVQSGVQFSRAIAPGLSFTLGTVLTGIRASGPESASFSHANFVTLAFAHDPWTLSTSISNLSMQPGVGLAPPQMLSLNEGLEFRLPGHLSLKMSATKINGSIPLSSANIALGTQF